MLIEFSPSQSGVCELLVYSGESGGVGITVFLSNHAVGVPGLLAYFSVILEYELLHVCLNLLYSNMSTLLKYLKIVYSCFNTSGEDRSPWKSTGTVN